MNTMKGSEVADRAVIRSKILLILSDVESRRSEALAELPSNTDKERGPCWQRYQKLSFVHRKLIELLEGS